MRGEFELEARDIKAIALEVADLLGPRLAALEAVFSKAIDGGQAKAKAFPVSLPSAAASAGSEMINLAEVKRLTGLSESSIWRNEKQLGSFPHRRKLSARRVGWSRSEVLTWIEGRQVV